MTIRDELLALLTKSLARYDTQSGDDLEAAEFRAMVVAPITRFCDRHKATFASLDVFANPRDNTRWDGLVSK